MDEEKRREIAEWYAEMHNAAQPYLRVKAIMDSLIKTAGMSPIVALEVVHTAMTKGKEYLK